MAPRERTSQPSGAKKGARRRAAPATARLRQWRAALAAFQAGDDTARLVEPQDDPELGGLCLAVNELLAEEAAHRSKLAAETLELAMGASEHLAALGRAEQGELSTRASESSPLDIVAKLGSAINRLLDTLEQAFRKERAAGEYARERTAEMLDVLERSAEGEAGVRTAASNDDDMGRLANGINALLDAKELASDQAHNTMLEVGIAVSEFLATLQAAEAGDLGARTQEGFANEALSTLGKMINRLLAALEEVTDDISEASQRVDSAAVELLSAAQQQSKANSEQAAALTENASAIEELAIAAKEIERRAHEVFSNARQNETLAERSIDAVSASSRAIEQIGTSTTEAAKCISALGEKSMAITEVTELIDGIASQTNLLALNAAIEAARAGEAGRGFSVVAVEIRKLAENVVESTKEIKRLIKEIQDSTSASVLATERVAREVDRGAEHAKQVAQSLERMQETLRTTSESAQGIQVSTSQQTAATDEMTKIVQEFTAFSQEAAKAARESFDSAEELTRLAGGLRKSAEKLQTSDTKRG